VHWRNNRAFAVRAYFYLDAENQPVTCDPFTWAEFFAIESNRRVGFTQITSQILVSTVFLGLDHSFGDDGPPILFETMVFGGDEDERQWRYSTWSDAEAGHNVVVKRLRKRYLKASKNTQVDIAREQKHDHEDGC
jgi:hypothetical protein